MTGYAPDRDDRCAMMASLSYIATSFSSSTRNGTCRFPPRFSKFIGMGLLRDIPHIGRNPGTLHIREHLLTVRTGRAEE